MSDWALKSLRQHAKGEVTLSPRAAESIHEHIEDMVRRQNSILDQVNDLQCNTPTCGLANEQCGNCYIRARVYDIVEGRDQ
jgi:hypothetical protein